eukprot:SAG31_NODE_12629_length_928_cov_1.728589_1_plen_77_part_00
MQDYAFYVKEKAKKEIKEEKEERKKKRRRRKQKSFHTYIQLKLHSDEWWFYLFWMWFLISCTVIALATRHNVVYGA